MMLLTNATTVAGDLVDVRLEGSRIGAVEPYGSLLPVLGEDELDLGGYVLLPAPAEPHAHLDKALTAHLASNPEGDLLGAIAAWKAIVAGFDHADYVARATEAALLGLANGVTAIRTHLNVGVDTGLSAVRALAQVKQHLCDAMTVQLVALIGVPLSGVDGAEHRALLRDAVDIGVDVVGGCPHLDPDPGACIDIVLRMAADHGLPVDLHTDETLDPSVLTLPALAQRVVATGFPHGVTASHCVSLGMQPPEVIKEVAELVAEAGVNVVTLPQTNLFLQARDRLTAPPRGITAVRALMDAGVTVAGGADNLRDPFNTMGRGDPMETATLLVMVAHLSPEEAYAAVSERARAVMGLPAVRLAPGHPADLLAIRARTLTEAVADGEADRQVFSRGLPVCGTTVVREMRLPPLR